MRGPLKWLATVSPESIWKNTDLVETPHFIDEETESQRNRGRTKNQDFILIMVINCLKWCNYYRTYFMGRNRNISKVPRIVSGLKILPYLWTNKWDLDADKRHETSGSETKDSITHSKSSGELHGYLLQVPMLPSFMRATQSAHDWCLQTKWVAFRRKKC